MKLDVTRERLAEIKAQELVSLLKIDNAADINVEAIAMTRNALVLDGGLVGAEARLTRSSKLNFIRVNSNIREAGRRRFAIAHELGHLLLQQSSQFALCTDMDLLPYYTNSPDELEASVFAGALLMPPMLFGPLCQAREPSLDFVRELAGQFQVTLTAAATRYIQYCPHRCCLVASVDKKVRYHRKTGDFGYFIRPGDGLDSATYAADFFEGKELPSGMHEVRATAWLEGQQIDPSKTIMEDSIGMPSYGSVLTLLWIDKDIDKYVSGEDEFDEEERSSNDRWSWNRYRDRE